MKSLSIFLFDDEASSVLSTSLVTAPAPAEKKTEKVTETTTSKNTTSSETVRFNNNAPVHFVENAENQEVITEEVVEIEE